MHLVNKLVGNWLVWVEVLRKFGRLPELGTRWPEISSLCLDPLWDPQPLSGLWYSLWSQGVGLCLHARYPSLAVGCLLPRCGAGLLDLDSFRGLWVLYAIHSRQFHISYVYAVAPLRVCAPQGPRTPPVVHTEVRDPSLPGGASSGWCWPWRVQTCGCVGAHRGSHR